jgi:hypothetical protein
MEWIFIAFLVVSMLHMGEEYFYPGGFMDLKRRVNPKFAPLVTVPMEVTLNGLELLLCLIAMAIGKKALAFSMSVAALLFINGLVHIIGCVWVKGYVPGVITGVVLFLPLSVYAYYLCISSGQLGLKGVILSAVLGSLYHAVPISYYLVASAIRRA